MKWIFRLLGAVVAVIVALVLLILLLPADKIARIAADQLRATTGRDVSIRGDVSLTFWPVLGVRAGDLEVGNASWAADGPMLQAEGAAIGIDVMSLLSGDIRITNIEAVRPTIRLEKKLDGRASWQFSDRTGSAQIETSTSPDRKPRSVSIERLEITDATLIYDAEGSDLLRYEGVNLTLDWPERLGPAKIEADARPAENVLVVSAEIDRFDAFLAGDVQTLRLTAELPKTSIGFDGRASTAGAVAGMLRLRTEDSGAMMRALGVQGVELPPKLGRRVDLTTELTLTPDRRMSLRDLTADLSGNRITGAADIALNGVPQVNAQLATRALDLTGVSGGERQPSGTGSGGSASGWSRAPIDASALAGFNGDISLTAESIDLGQFDLGPTRAVLRNDNSRMSFDLREVRAYGGMVTGEFVINNRSGLSVGGKLAARAIQMQPLLADAIDLDRLTGEGNVELSFLGSGPSVHAIMNSLSGSGSLAIGRGTIEGIDLDRLLSSGDIGGGTTIFDDLTASWTIAEGVLRNRDLLVELKNYSASGEGRVGIGARDLDYTFTPVALRANSGRGLSIPVRFVGPWSDVSIRPDIDAALDAQVDEQKEKLEERAKEELSRRLRIEKKEGQSLEDAIKEQGAEKLLRKLFK